MVALRGLIAGASPGGARALGSQPLVASVHGLSSCPPGSRAQAQ